MTAEAGPTAHPLKEVPPPPWVVFNRGDGLCDILPAMRDGDVLEGLPPALARELVMFANSGALGVGGRLAAIIDTLRAVEARIKEDGALAPKASGGTP